MRRQYFSRSHCTVVGCTASVRGWRFIMSNKDQSSNLILLSICISFRERSVVLSWQCPLHSKRRLCPRSECECACLTHRIVHQSHAHGPPGLDLAADVVHTLLGQCLARQQDQSVLHSSTETPKRVRFLKHSVYLLCNHCQASEGAPDTSTWDAYHNYIVSHITPVSPHCRVD